jgi:hypothetical protein
MSHYLKRTIAVAAGAAALAVGGAAIADASSSSSTTSTTSTAIATPAVPQFNGPAHGTAAHEDAEKAVTGTAAASAKAAAIKSVGSGTAGDVTSDFTGSGYEVTVTKADGSAVEVHLDSSFNAFQGRPGDRDAPGSA